MRRHQQHNAAKAAELQRHAAARRAERNGLDVFDEDLYYGDSDNEELECDEFNQAADAVDGLGIGGRSGGGGSSGVRLSYSEQCVQLEQHFRQHGEIGLEYRELLAEPLAGYLRRDQELCLEEMQRRVVQQARCPLHPGCSAAASSVQVRSWRRVRYRFMIGTGWIHIPTFW